MVLEVLVDWTGPQGGGIRNVLFFNGNTSGEAAVARNTTSQWLGEADASITTDYTWNIVEEVRSLNTVTGQLVEVFSGGIPLTGQGGNTSEPVADATQMLIRWNTGVVVNGRVLKGRTYLPGMGSDGLLGGNIDPAIASYQTTSAQELLTGSPEFVIWHRPVNGSGGVAHGVIGGSCWTELAVQRRRRA